MIYYVSPRTPDFNTHLYSTKLGRDHLICWKGDVLFKGELTTNTGSYYTVFIKSSTILQNLHECNSEDDCFLKGFLIEEILKTFVVTF